MLCVVTATVMAIVCTGNTVYWMEGSRVCVCVHSACVSISFGGKKCVYCMCVMDRDPVKS